jgi:hypothetical protein
MSPEIPNYKSQITNNKVPFSPFQGKFEARGFEAQKYETTGRPSDIFKTPAANHP